MVFAVALVLAFEGIVCAAFPSAMKRAMQQAGHLPEGAMRIAGLASAVVGVALLWLIKAA
ncbi:MAG TPA: DUF2065 domain-containing protein [Beijerinckiaceae bacterium]|nr:DUF2065 domain-containing protein [Beijerinckiaceae bacterium]